MTDRTFPILPSFRGTKAEPNRIPWSVAEKAYRVYVARHGGGQSIDRIAERGGFSASELDTLYPQWRLEVAHD